MNNYTSVNRHKYYLKVHLVFVCKYRKELLVNNDIDFKVKQIFKDTESKSDFIIDIMETDIDHMHLLVSYPPKISISSIVCKLKQGSTISLWEHFPVYLSKQFWKEHTFWSDSYFACSIGEASPETIRRYIENQGQWHSSSRLKINGFFCLRQYKKIENSLLPVHRVCHIYG